MFEDLMARLSLRRSMSGIYFEIRTLRQMFEIWSEAAGLESVAARRHRLRGTPQDEIDVQPETEEQLAARIAAQIEYDRLQGKDPGTTWMPDPER